MPLIDRLMPVFDRNEVHETVVRATPERVARAVRDVTPEEIRFFRLLTWLRGSRRKRLQAMGLTDGTAACRCSTWRSAAGSWSCRRTTARSCWGVIGRFWRPSGGRVEFADAAGFESGSNGDGRARPRGTSTSTNRRLES